MKKLFEKKQIRVLMACISLLLLVNLIQETYAKYISSADASGNFTIAKWVFNINNQDVLANSDFSEVVVPVLEDNDYIVDGVIAPTAKAYFEITIDSTDVDVAYTENITVTKDENNTVSDLIITGYKKNDGPLITVSDPETLTLSQEYDLGEQGTNKYTFYLEWNDDENEETMDNAMDTLQTIDGVAAFNVTVNFVQNAS